MTQQKIIPIQMVGGVSPDSIEEDKQIADVVNAWPMPDGRSMRSRGGSEICQRYFGATNPVGRVALTLDSVPNRTDGTQLVVATDTNGGAIKILNIHRPVVFGEGDSLVGVFTIASPSYNVNFLQAVPDSGTVPIVVSRSEFTNTTATVRLITSPGTAIAGVAGPPITGDYVHTDTTLTFTPGQTSQTVNITTLNYPSGASPYVIFNVYLTNPSAGAQLGYPHRAEITIYRQTAIYPVMWYKGNTSGTGGATTDARLMMYDSSTNLCTAYLLKDFGGQASFASMFFNGHWLFRSGMDDLMYLTAVSTASNVVTVYASIYSIASIVAAGGAYSTVPVIKVAPRGVVTLGTMSESDFTNMRVGWTFDRKVALINNTTIYNLDQSALTFSSVSWTIPAGYERAYGPGHNSYEGNQSMGIPIDRNGYIIMSIFRISDGAGQIIRIKPSTGAIMNQGPTAPVADGLFAATPMLDGRIFASIREDTTSVIVLDEDLSTYASYSSAASTITDVVEDWIQFSTNENNEFFGCTIAAHPNVGIHKIESSSISNIQTYVYATEGLITYRAHWLTSGTFVSTYVLGGGSNMYLRFYTTASSTRTSQTQIVDQYNGEASDSILAALDVSNHYDMRDVTFYVPRNVSGRSMQ